MSEDLKAQLRTQYGLDKPLPVQLGVYLDKVLHGDLGHSYFFNLPVSGLIAERLPATLLLVICLGVAGVRRRHGTGCALVATAERTVVAGDHRVFDGRFRGAGVLDRHHADHRVRGQVYRGFRCRACAPSSRRPAPAPSATCSTWRTTWCCPTLTLSLVYLAQYSRLARASMLDVLGSDYVRTARAKGLPERVVLYKHASAQCGAAGDHGARPAVRQRARRRDPGRDGLQLARARAVWPSSRCCAATTRRSSACCCSRRSWWW